MVAIHELFVLALSLVWFAGATPEGREKTSYKKRTLSGDYSDALDPPLFGLQGLWPAAPGDSFRTLLAERLNKMS